METKEYRLGELAKFSNGINFDKEAYFGNGIRLITVSDFGNNFSPAYESLIEVSNEVVKEKDLISKNDILFVRSNGNKELVGRCMLIDNVDKPTTYSGFCIKCHFDNEELTNPKYFTYYFKDQYFRKCISNASDGTNIQNLNQEILSKHKVQLPPLPTQQKIASILSAYDNLIQNYKKQIEALQTAASELYKEWFVRFRFPGWKNAKFENGIPEGWKVEKLGTLANISTGKCNREDAEDDGIYPLFDRSQEIKKSNEWIKDCEAIIVPGEGTSFIPRYYKGKFNLHQRCYCVEPKYPDFGKFLFYVLMLNRKYFLSVATGATVPSLRYNNFASMKFILPEISLCNNFNKIANDIFAKVDNLQQQISNLTQQRDLLLPRLMSGKLEV